MAYGNGSKFERNDNIFFFSQKSKDKDGKKVAPFFEISRPNGDKIEKLEETATEVGGTLIKVKVEEGEWQGSKTFSAKLYLKDESRKELYVVNTSFRMDSRSLYNGLINLETYDNVNISTYQTKKLFPAYSIKQNGNRVDWKYKIEELPEPITVMLKGKKVNDYTPIDEFFVKELNELAARLSGKKSESVPETASTTSSSDTSSSEDVPF
jgi:hypothetical protein